jgi:5-methylcytosine-specific restriction protein A
MARAAPPATRKSQRPPIPHWWADNLRERYWLESTDRHDIGADLKAPLLDAKMRENWRYCLFREARIGDIVYHYDKNRRAITASSIVAGPPEPRRITWKARGTSARSRKAVFEEVDGYRVPLRDTEWLTKPVTLEELRANKPLLHDAEAAILGTRRGAVYFPFELSKRPVRPLQGYAFKLPEAFITAFPQLTRDRQRTAEPRVPWQDDELAICVEAYIDLLERQARRDHPNYAQVQRDLADRLRRGRGAIDRRMQTISLFLSRRKAPIVVRFPPGQSISPGIEQRLKSLLEVRLPTADPDELERLTKKAREHGNGRQAPAPCSNGADFELQQTKRYKRRADVKAWVLEAAGNTCEACGSEAPFVGADGYPFLEVHHMRPLAEGGPDCTTNAAGVCPNCHRRLHFAADRNAYRLDVIARIERLRDYARSEAR